MSSFLKFASLWYKQQSNDLFGHGFILVNIKLLQRKINLITFCVVSILWNVKKQMGKSMEIDMWTNKVGRGKKKILVWIQEN
jgi:hypothetical protein